jgi:UPF0755 protein
MKDFEYNNANSDADNPSKLSFSGKASEDDDSVELSSGRSLLDDIDNEPTAAEATAPEKSYDFDRFMPRKQRDLSQHDGDSERKDQTVQSGRNDTAEPDKTAIDAKVKDAGHDDSADKPGISEDKSGEVDEFVIGSGFDINRAAGTHKPQPVSGRGGKKRIKNRWVSVIIWVAVILGLAVGLASGMMLGFSDMFGIGKNQICQVTITEGMSTAQVAETLEEAGAIEYPLLFRIYSKFKKYDGTYRYGVYEFNSNKGYDGIVEELQVGNEIQTVSIRIPEKATVDDIIALFEENKVCTKAQFLTAMRDGEYQYDFIKYIPEEKVRYRFEGYLYPDTYSFFVGESVENAHRAIDKMLNNLNSKLPDNYQKLCDDYGYSFHEVMTMASIVELEANGSPDEMKKVAAVFYNRLSWDEPKYLGSTPTYNYPDNRYNTNAPDGDDSTEDGYEGLPPGPQCSMTIDAIKGCLEPENPFSATYFVTDSDMNFYYMNSYSEFLKVIERLKANGKWTY